MEFQQQVMIGKAIFEFNSQIFSLRRVLCIQSAGDAVSRIKYS